MKYIFLLAALFIIAACSPSSQLKKHYTPEDKTVFELLEKLSKDPSDKAALDKLPSAYQFAAEKRKQLNQANYNSLPPGDRYMQLVKEYGVMQQLYEKIAAIPSAKNAVPDLWDPSVAMTTAKNNAAKEYYNQGLEYMNYDNRQAARNAYDYFSKANSVIPGYQDVRTLMQQASERATIKVIVRAPNYYNHSWDYWGFQNDWLQQQIINDLNSQSFRDVRFYSDWEANSKRIRPDRIVELNFTELYVGQFFSNRYTINRSKQIQTGTTKSIPPKPIYKTVYATLFVNSRYMQSRATLECRIYDQANGNNLLYDRFPDNYDWRVETATYTGDQQALQPSDWDKINNNGNINPPNKTQIADRLIRNCYNLLLNRIKSGVQFGS
jgi:hypothetical protein